MPAGAPSLGVNFAYDPFGPELPTRRRRRDDEDLMREHTGFSPDGLSYSVAGDYGKLAGQIWADYEAARSNPQGLFETSDAYKARVAAAPERLRNEITNLRMLFGDYDAPRPSLSKFVETPTGYKSVNTETGEVTDLINYPAKPTKEETFPGPTEVELGTKTPKSFKEYTAKEWLNLQPTLPPSIATNAPVAAYADWGRQSNAVPSLTVNAPAGTNAPAKRRLTFNPKTGKLE